MKSGIIWSAAENKKKPFAAETGRTALMKDPCALEGARVFFMWKISSFKSKRII